MIQDKMHLHDDNIVTPEGFDFNTMVNQSTIQFVSGLV